MRLRLLASLLLTLIIGSSAIAQQQFQLDASTSMLLHEFRAVLSQEDDLIKVRMPLSNEETEGDKLERGDVILMMNGQRFKNIEELRAIYEAIAVDEEIKIGVRRVDDRFILRATKESMVSSSNA